MLPNIVMCDNNNEGFYNLQITAKGGKRHIIITANPISKIFLHVVYGFSALRAAGNENRGQKCDAGNAINPS